MIRSGLNVKYIFLQPDRLFFTVSNYNSNYNQQGKDNQYPERRAFYQLDYKRIPFHFNIVEIAEPYKGKVTKDKLIEQIFLNQNEALRCSEETKINSSVIAVFKK